MKVVKLFLFVCFIYCASAPLNAQDKIPVDTVFLFLSQKEWQDQSKDRMVGDKFLQITNYAGNTLLIRMSCEDETKKQKDVVIHSPEKIVFLCPKDVKGLNIIINPDYPDPAYRKISRDGKYELFYNVENSQYDILQLEEK